MFVLHVELTLKPGSQRNLEKIFKERFYPAISIQGGFIDAQLLRSNETDTNYRLCLSFDQQASQQTWVASGLHQDIWPLVENLCDGYTVAGYTAI